MSDACLLERQQPHFQYPPHRLGWKTEASTGYVVPVINPLQPSVPLAGKLFVRILKGRNLHRTHVISRDKMDAFVEVKIGKNKTKTHVCKDGGVNPVWDDTMQFDLTGEEDVIRIKVYNKNMISDDVIGVARIPLNYLIMMSGHPNDIDSDPLKGKEHDVVNEEDEQFRRLIAGNSHLSAAKKLLLLSVLDVADRDLPNERFMGRRNMWFALGRDKKMAAQAGHLMLGFDFVPLNDEVDFIPVDNGQCSALTLAASPFFSAGADGGAGVAGGSAQYAGEEGVGLGSAHTEKGGKRGKDDEQLFGGTLAAGVRRSAGDVPLVLEQCVEYIRVHGINNRDVLSPCMEGVVPRWQEAFENDELLVLNDVQAALGLLTLYLTSLSDPLMPAKSQSAFFKALSVEKDDSKRLKALAKLVAQLPIANRLSLAHIVSLCKAIAGNSAVNGSSRQACADYFAPLVFGKVPAKEAKSKKGSKIKDDDLEAHAVTLMKIMLEAHQVLLPEIALLDSKRKEEP